MGEEEQSVKMEQQTTDDGVQRKGPMIVSFPKKQPDHLLKLEVEDVDQGMNPRNIWQVGLLKINEGLDIRFELESDLRYRVQAIRSKRLDVRRAGIVPMARIQAAKMELGCDRQI
eukprot:Gb_29467 [translate_table: standard]